MDNYEMKDCLPKGYQWLIKNNNSLGKDPVALLNAAIENNFTIDIDDMGCIIAHSGKNILFQVPLYVSDFVAHYVNRIGADKVLGISQGIGNCFARTCDKLDEGIEAKNLSLLQSPLTEMQSHFLGDKHNSSVYKIDDISGESESYPVVYGEFFKELVCSDSLSFEYENDQGDLICVKDDKTYCHLLSVMRSLNDDAVGIFVIEESFFQGEEQSVYRNLHKFGLSINAVSFVNVRLRDNTGDELRKNYLLFVKKEKDSKPFEFFVAFLRGEHEADDVCDNLLNYKRDSNICLGMITKDGEDIFESYDIEYAKHQCVQYIRTTNFRNMWGEAVVAVNLLENIHEITHARGEYAVYIPVVQGKTYLSEYNSWYTNDGYEWLGGQVMTDPDIDIDQYVQIILNREICDVEYVCRFLNSDIGCNFVRVAVNGTIFDEKRFISYKCLPLPSLSDQKYAVLKQDALKAAKVKFECDVERQMGEVWYG